MSTKNPASPGGRRGATATDTTPEPNAYRIEITIPLGLPAELRKRLFEGIADLVHDWEPEDRVGWDAFVSGHAIYDDLA